MDYVLDLVADSTIKGRIYPALAQHQGRPYTPSWREFGQHWPYTTPLRMQEYCEQHGVPLAIHCPESYPPGSFYPICLGFFDFEIDYFDLLPATVKQGVIRRDLKVLFLYHEGDNPQSIKRRLDALCELHSLPNTGYVFVSANSAADQLPGFVTFHDFELWYYQRNLNSVPHTVHNSVRNKDFVVLSRLHRWWRAVAMADLWRLGVLDNSYWSYCEPLPNNTVSDCPIEIDLIPQLRWNLSRFAKELPHFCDGLSQEQRNDHAITEYQLYDDAYCNIVLESQFDVDHSGGAFVTEKTFKPIKHGQLFFVAGGMGSLQVLRDLGYDVFDDILDNRYDQQPNATTRWTMLTAAVQLARPNLPQLFAQALPRIQHNQQLFQASKKQRLNRLIEKIYEQPS